MAHEFLHIVTPLAIHAQQINDFDFYSPSMSKHLWLYEGVTEYTSVLVQVQQGLMSLRSSSQSSKASCALQTIMIPTCP